VGELRFDESLLLSLVIIIGDTKEQKSVGPSSQLSRKLKKLLKPPLLADGKGKDTLCGKKRVNQKSITDLLFLSVVNAM
jgi:hypothetical protein